MRMWLGLEGSFRGCRIGELGVWRVEGRPGEEGGQQAARWGRQGCGGPWESPMGLGSAGCVGVISAVGRGLGLEARS